MRMTSAGRSNASEILQADAPMTGAARLSRASHRRARLGFGAVGVLLAASALAAATSVAATPPTVTEAFSSTGAEQLFTVPAGVTSVRVQVIGGAGHAATSSGYELSPSPGGVGAEVAGTLPVTPGETLYVEVAAGNLNQGGQAGAGGGEGGGASDVRTVPTASTGSLESRLLVAGGGGGAGGAYDEGSGGRGGDAGTSGGGGAGGGPIENVSNSGGGAGTLTGGGLGAAICEAPNAWSGGNGALGLGGGGGASVVLSNTGGGGGGAGYWGGGGGEGACERSPFSGGGGGGGSSFVEEDAKSVSFGLASSSTAPSVTISYATPATATPNTSTITFAETQPLATVSAPQTITLTNDGGDPLKIAAATFADSSPALSTDHPEDFLIGSSSCSSPIAFDESCQLTVRFAPQGTGTRTATLQIAGNIGAGPTVITLTGTGGTLPQGAAGAAGTSGAQGVAGASGKSGSVGPAGAKGPAGPRGQRGPQGLPAVYLCHPRQRHGKYEKACFVHVLTGAQSASRATLRRAGVVYASGTVNGPASTGSLLLSARRTVPAGSYTLVFSSKRRTTSETVTVG